MSIDYDRKNSGAAFGVGECGASGARGFAELMVGWRVAGGYRRYKKEKRGRKTRGLF